MICAQLWVGVWEVILYYTFRIWLQFVTACSYHSFCVSLWRLRSYSISCVNFKVLCIGRERESAVIYACFVGAFVYCVAEWSGALWTDTNVGYQMTLYSVNHGRPTFLWQKSIPVIVVWFAGSARKNNSGVRHTLNYCGWRPRVTDPCRKRSCALNRSLGKLQLSGAPVNVNVLSVAVL